MHPRSCNDIASWDLSMRLSRIYCILETALVKPPAVLRNDPTMRDGVVSQQQLEVEKLVHDRLVGARMRPPGNTPVVEQDPLRLVLSGW